MLQQNVFYDGDNSQFLLSSSSQKQSHSDFSVTKRGIKDPLVSKRSEKVLNKKKKEKRKKKMVNKCQNNQHRIKRSKMVQHGQNALKWSKMVKKVNMVKNGGPDLKRARHTGVSTRRA